MRQLQSLLLYSCCYYILLAYVSLHKEAMIFEMFMLSRNKFVHDDY